MSLIVLYHGTRYDVCEFNSLRDMTISSFFFTFDLCLWPSSFVNVTLIFIIRWTLCGCCVLVQSTNFVGSVEFEIRTIVWRTHKWRHNNIITHSISMKFNTNLSRVSKRHTGFILIEHKKAEIQSRDVNKELWRKNGYYVTVTLTFDLKSPISISQQFWTI